MPIFNDYPYYSIGYLGPTPEQYIARAIHCEKPLISVYRAILPFFALLAAVLLLITYFPELSLLFIRGAGAIK